MKKICLIVLSGLIGGLLLRAQSNTNTAPQQARGPTRIYSDSADFYMARHRAVYRGHVRVEDPQMELACAQITADLPSSGGRPSRIVAETNVTIDFLDDKGQTNHASCDNAVYDYSVQGGMTNETVTLSGHACVTNADGSWIKGEPIIWDRVNNSVHATNEQISIKQNIGGMMASTNSPASKTNRPAAPKLF